MTDLTGLNSQALSINNRGQVVGVSTSANGVGQAFVYENGKIAVLGTLGGDFSSPSSVNERGEVVGTSANVNGDVRPCIWRSN
jgi:probable HAF family extracellular repeat protein